MNTRVNKSDPFFPIHPGEIVKDEIEYRGIKQRDLAAKMGISHSQLNEILNGKRQVNTEIALLFEAALGIEPVTLINMQTGYNMQTARQDINLTRRLDAIRELYASSLL
ncbi:MAG: HigA family addiction module antidote protein [Tannerellaceae bacterium]|jgi:addiction module HigA family antidote|nr:HigA family addiction module antidote protein [Tannerellaceae bacterium]